MTASLDGVNPDARNLIYRVVALWGLIAFSWVIITTTAPLILKDIVGPASAAKWLGVFTATTGASGLIFCSLLGYFSDRAGRTDMVIPWAIAWVVANACVLYAETNKALLPLWIARVVAISIMHTILHAFTSDFVQGPALLQAHGYLGAGFGISMLCGSFACAILGHAMSRATPLYLALAFSGILFHSVRSLRIPAFAQVKGTQGSYLEAISVIRGDPLLRNVVFGFALYRVAHVNAFFMFVLFSNYRVGWGIYETSLALGIAGFLGVIWQIFGVKFIVNRHEHTISALYVVLTLCPLVMFWYGSTTTSFGMYIAAFSGSITSVGMSIFTAKTASLGSEDGIAGLALGLVGSLMNLLEIAFSLIYGELLAWTIANCEVTDFCAGTPYYVNGCLFAVVLLFIRYTDYRYGHTRSSWHGASLISDP